MNIVKQNIFNYKMILLLLSLLFMTNLKARTNLEPVDSLTQINDNKVNQLLKLNNIYLNLDDVNSSKELLKEIMIVYPLTDSIQLQRDSVLKEYQHKSQIHQSFSGRLMSFINENIPSFVGVILIIFLLWLILLFIRKIIGKRNSKKRIWKLEVPNDNSPANLSSQIIAKLIDWNDSPQALSGLLQVKLKMPSSVIFNSFKIEFDQGSLPTVQGIELGTILRTFSLIKKWINSYSPWIIIKIFYENRNAYINISVKNYKQKSYLISETINIDQVYTKLIESISFKMYHIISTPEFSNRQISHLDEFLNALNLLNNYIINNGADKSVLISSHQILTELITKVPDLFQVYLIDGVVLDLLGEHKEAIIQLTKLQSILSESNEDSKHLTNQAKYNEAVCRFRTYLVSEFSTAENIFTELMTLEIENPTIALASTLGKANVIAHKYIYWTKILFEKNTSEIKQDEVEKYKSKYKTKLQDWFKEVLYLTSKVEGSDFSQFDKSTQNQLNWGINNARGNLYLNFAKYVLNIKSMLKKEDEKVYNEYLKLALTYFEKTEQYLPRGVESLSNRATVYSQLGMNDKAINLLEEVLKLNDNYEYADYRIIEILVKTDRDEAKRYIVKRNLSSTKTNIEKFKKILEDLGY